MSASIKSVKNAREAHHLSGESGELSAEGASADPAHRSHHHSSRRSRCHRVGEQCPASGAAADAISSIVSTIIRNRRSNQPAGIECVNRIGPAGEQGRGLPWVADEVRKLAERSTAVSTQEIAEVIRQIQSGTREVTAEITASVDKQLAKAPNWLPTLRPPWLASGPGRRSGGLVVNDIPAALAEQTTAGADIARNVEQIAGMAENNERAVSRGPRCKRSAAIGRSWLRSVDQIRL